MPNYLLIEIQNQSLVTRQCMVRRKQYSWQSPQGLTCAVDLNYPSNLQADVLTQLDLQWRAAYKTTAMSVAVALPSSYLWESQFNHPDQLTPQQCFTYVEYHMQQVMQEQNMVLAWDYSSVANQPLIVLAVAQPVLQFFQQLCDRHQCQLTLLTSEQHAVQKWGEVHIADEAVMGQLCNDQLKLFYLTQHIVKHQQSFHVTHVDDFVTAMEQFRHNVKLNQVRLWLTGETKRINSWVAQWQTQSSWIPVNKEVTAPQSFISQGLLMGMRDHD